MEESTELKGDVFVDFYKTGAGGGIYKSSGGMRLWITTGEQGSILLAVCNNKGSGLVLVDLVWLVGLVTYFCFSLHLSFLIAINHH